MIVSGALWLTGASAAEAHDFYLLPDSFAVRPSSVVHVSFNNGDSFPVSENYPIPARVKGARLLRADAPAVDVEHIHVAGNRLRGSVNLGDSRGDALLVARTQPHLIVLDHRKFTAYLKEEGLTDVIEWRRAHHESQLPGRERYSKYAKAMLSGVGADGFVSTVVGFPLEIIPGAMVEKTGQPPTLPVKVLFKGREVEGLPIEATWAAAGESKTAIVGRTDASGHLAIPLTHHGYWRLHALKMERCSDRAAADWASYWSSLTFEIKLDHAPAPIG